MVGPFYRTGWDFDQGITRREWLEYRCTCGFTDTRPTADAKGERAYTTETHT